MLKGFVIKIVDIGGQVDYVNVSTSYVVRDRSSATMFYVKDHAKAVAESWKQSSPVDRVYVVPVRD